MRGVGTMKVRWDFGTMLDRGMDISVTGICCEGQMVGY